MVLGVQPANVESIARDAEEIGGTVVRMRSALVIVLALEAETETAPKRIPVSDVVSHGAPSVAWVQERARRGEIGIAGPRGARTVDAVELAALLATTTIARRSRVAPHPVASTTDVVADLAARRARRSA